MISSKLSWASLILFVVSINALQLQKISGPASSSFGSSLAMSQDGSIVVTGAPYKTIGSNANQGEVYVYTKSGTSWSQSATLTASDGAANDLFGSTVAMDAAGDVIVVSSTGFNSNSGKVYIYTKGSTYVESKLVPSDASTGAKFGYSLAVSSTGSIILVGSYCYNVGANSKQGKVYYYTQSGSAWNETRIVASNGAATDQFGTSVAMNAAGTVLIVGAQGTTVGSNSAQGTVYIYTSPPTWVETIVNSFDGASGDNFGDAATIDAAGDIAVVSASCKNYGGLLSSGVVYLLTKNSTGWAQTRFKASDAQAAAQYGASVAISSLGTSFVVGSVNFNLPQRAKQGQVYLYTLSQNVWGQTIFDASDTSATPKYVGTSVAMSSDGSLFAIGSPGDSSSYVFNTTPTPATTTPTKSMGTQIKFMFLTLFVALLLAF